MTAVTCPRLVKSPRQSASAAAGMALTVAARDQSEMFVWKLSCAGSGGGLASELAIHPRTDFDADPTVRADRHGPTCSEGQCARPTGGRLRQLAPQQGDLALQGRDLRRQRLSAARVCRHRRCNGAARRRQLHCWRRDLPLDHHRW